MSYFQRHFLRENVFSFGITHIFDTSLYVREPDWPLCFVLFTSMLRHLGFFSITKIYEENEVCLPYHKVDFQRSL